MYLDIKKRSEKNKEWYKKNPNKMREYGYKYWLSHKEEIKKRNKLYRQKNIDKIIFWASMRRTNGSHTLKEWQEKLNKTNGVCPGCCQKKKLTKDHILPIYFGGSNNIDNVQPLCQSCNSSKGLDIWKAEIIHINK